MKIPNMRSIIRPVMDWFENGDLVPLLIVVSAFHYAAILKDKDAPVVAVSIGILVDLGHFRTIRAAFRYHVQPSKRKRKGNWFVRMASRINGQLAARWIIAAVMTAISYAYHERYYGDVWLSAPLPFLIAALAWLQRVDARTGTRRASERTEPSETTPLVFRFNCEYCEYRTNDQRAWAGHSRKHKKKSETPAHVNGKVRTEV